MWKHHKIHLLFITDVFCGLFLERRAYMDKADIKETRFRVNGQIYDFSKLSPKEQVRLCQQWRHTAKLECLCNGYTNPNPPILHVNYRSSSKTYYVSNNKKNRGNFAHAFNCPYNHKDTGYRNYLSQQGITITDDGGIICQLKLSREKKGADNKNARVSLAATTPGSSVNSSSIKKATTLWTFFHTLLKEMNVDNYVPGQQRNIANRFFPVAAKTKVNNTDLYSRIFVANEANRRPNPFKHEFIIGWGDLQRHPVQTDQNRDYLVRIPLLSLSDRKTVICTLTCYKKVYDDRKERRVSGNAGYWVLWRVKNPKGEKLQDHALIFVHAEEITMIPIESSYEDDMIKHLVSLERHFLKPIIGNVTSLFIEMRPDMLLFDTSPFTIIEVAGMQNEEYRHRLKEKRTQYINMGYQYLEWDGVTPLGNIPLPNKKEEHS